MIVIPREEAYQKPNAWTSPWIVNLCYEEAASFDLAPSLRRDVACISITERGHSAVLPEYGAILRLQFADWDPDHHSAHAAAFFEKADLFTPEQADQIVEFAHAHRGRSFVVHCAAGVSRSGGVVEAILAAFPEYRDVGRLRYPNNFVRRLCRRAFGLVPLGAESR